jgi:hypothetical protein
MMTAPLPGTGAGTTAPASRFAAHAPAGRDMQLAAGSTRDALVAIPTPDGIVIVDVPDGIVGRQELREPRQQQRGVAAVDAARRSAKIAAEQARI